MNRLFYLSWPQVIIVLVFATVLPACMPRAARIDARRLEGLPEETLAEVTAAKKEWLAGKVMLEKLRVTAVEIRLELTLAQASRRVADEQVEMSRAAFSLASHRKVTEDMAKASESQSASMTAAELAAADVEVAKARVTWAEAKVDEAEARTAWLEAKMELQRAKIAIKNDSTTPHEKSAALNEYEQAVIGGELVSKKAEGKVQLAQVDVDQARARRDALNKTK